MAEKSILLAVADPQVLVDITQTLGARWEASLVSSEADARAQLEERSFDALLVDFNLSESDASELLNQALEKRPETVRFLFAYEADLALVAARVLGPYQILPKPIDYNSLKSRIEKEVAPEELKSDPSSSDLGREAGVVPTLPPVYAEVLNALNTPGITSAQVGEIIAQDAALTTELLELTHSAYLGMPRNITDAGEAVELLGVEPVKALMMALQFLSEHRKLEPGYFSFEATWRHSTNVARLARDLVLFETQDRTLASEALAAGLLHDFGKVVLIQNFDDLYGRVHSLARKQPVPIWEIEKEIFGANHGEIGGCLIGMWNMPLSVVEAAALHHDPPLGERQDLDALAAVHIANVLEHEIHPNEEGFLAPIINTAFLNELGLLHRLPVWRAAIARRSFANLERTTEWTEADEHGTLPPAPSTAPPPRSANRLSGPTASTGTRSLAETTLRGGQPTVPDSRHQSMRWVYAGAAAVLFILALLWLGKQPESNTPQPIYARTPAADPVAVAVSPTPPPETATAVAPENSLSTTARERQSETSVSSATVPEPATSLSEPEPTPTIAAPQAVITNAPAPRVSEKTPPDFRLNGVIYASARPFAIVNGKTVCVGDRVNSALVINIGRTNVTLRINGQQKIYTLRQ